MRRQPVGFSLAWLAVILLVPFFGAAFYFLVGEKRLGNIRVKWTEKLARDYQPWRDKIKEFEFTDWSSDQAKRCELVPISKSK